MLEIVKVEMIKSNVAIITNKAQTLFIEIELDVFDPGAQDLLHYMKGESINYFYADVEPPDFNIRTELFPEWQDW